MEGTRIPIRNVYYMLSYAFQALRQKEYRSLEAEEFSHVHDLLAAVLCVGISRQLKQGLYREYIEHSEELQTLRGRINMGGTIAARLAHRRSVACTFDELSADNALNQAIKATCLLLLRHGNVAQERKRSLRKELLLMQDVSEVDPRGIKWSDFRGHRGNQNILMLLSVCQMVAEGMLLTSRNGEFRLAEFVDDQRLYHLYEKFVLNYFAREHPEVKASSPHIQWATDDGALAMLPTMRSDIMLSQGDRELIIDAKYYGTTMQSNYGTLTIRSDHLYQIFTYVKNRDASFGDVPHKVSGMLLYARTNESVQPNQTYHLSGNRVDARTLDLNRDFPEIAAQLDGIVSEFFD